VQFDPTIFPYTLTANTATALIVMNFNQTETSYIGYIANPIASYEWNAQNDKVIAYGSDFYKGNLRIHIKNIHSASITFDASYIHFCIIYLDK
jgi:hypothetical protein